MPELPPCGLCKKVHPAITREAERGFRALGFSWGDIQAIRHEVREAHVAPDSPKTSAPLREAQRRYYLRKKALASGTPIPPEARRRRKLKGGEQEDLEAGD